MRNKIGIPLYKTAVTLKKMTYEELAVIEPNQCQHPGFCSHLSQHEILF